MDEARLGADDFGQMGQEGDDVVLGLALDLVDPLDLEGAALPDRLGGRFGNDAEFGQGVAGMARDSNPDSGNSQFFLMRARFPSLESKYTAWGRVISGMDVVRAIKTGEPVEQPQDRMERVRVLADLPEAERPKVRVIDPKGPWFKAEIAHEKTVKGAGFSACDVEIPVEVK